MAAPKGNKYGKNGGRPTLYRVEMCEKVVEFGKLGDSITTIAVKLGIRKQTVYEWCRAHQEFADAIKESQEYAQKWWEQQMLMAATGANKDANATLMIFTMKNRFRDDWRDKIDQEISGKNGGAIEVKATITMTPEEAYKAAIGK